MAILQLIPLLVMLVLYAAYLKLAARIRRFSGVSWRHCFAFSSMIVALAIGAQVLAMVGGLALPPFVHTIGGVFLQLGLAAWFFRGRGTTSSGQPLGWWEGAQIALVGMILLLCTAGLLFTLTYMLAPNAQP